MTDNHIDDSDIESKKATFISEKNDKQYFDNDRFMSDAKKLQESNGDLSQLNVTDYVKDKEKTIISDGNAGGLHYNIGFHNNQFVATGPNGQEITGKNPDELNQKLAQEYVKDAEKKGKFPYAKLRTFKDDKEFMESFARNFIMSGVRVAGDLPEDPKFWQNLKQEYMQKDGNSEEMWNKLTKYVPDKSMGRERKPEQNMGKFVHNLRNGINTNLTPPQQTPQIQKTQVNQAQMQKWMANSQSM